MENKVYGSYEELLNGVSQEVNIGKEQIDKVIQLAWPSIMNNVSDKLKQQAITESNLVRDIEH